MKSRQYELKPLQLLDNRAIEELNAEFVEQDGECYILYMLEEKSIEEMKKEMSEDTHSYVLAFLVDGNPTGLVRLTPKLNHVENGQIGWAIRPAKRENGFASIMIRMAAQLANEELGCKELTACIDSKNKASIKVARKAGLSMSGNVYHWSNNRISIEFVVRA